LFQEDTTSGGVKAPHDDAQDISTTGRPKQQNVGRYKDGPAIIRRLPIDGESYYFSFSNTLVCEWEHPVPAVANRGRTSNYHPN